MSRARRLIGLVTILLSGLGPACADPYWTARVEHIHRRDEMVFVLRTDNPLRELDVLRISEEGKEEVLWRITRSDGGSKAPREIAYGVIPEGFRQVLPRSGSPEPLEPASYLVRCRDYALGDEGNHYLRLGSVGEKTWRVKSDRQDRFGEADLLFRVHLDGRIQRLGPDFIDAPGP